MTVSADRTTINGEFTCTIVRNRGSSQVEMEYGILVKLRQQAQAPCRILLNIGPRGSYVGNMMHSKTTISQTIHLLGKLCIGDLHYIAPGSWTLGQAWICPRGMAWQYGYLFPSKRDKALLTYQRYANSLFCQCYDLFVPNVPLTGG